MPGIIFLFAVLSASQFAEEVSWLIKKPPVVKSDKLNAQLASLARQKILFFPEALLFNLRSRVLEKVTLEAGSVNSKLWTEISELQKRYEENDSLIYIENVFSDAFFNRLVSECKRLWKSPDSEIEGNCNLDGRDRLGGYVKLISDNPDSVYNLIYGNEELLDLISRVSGGKKFFHPADFPIEIREYGPDSAGMRCHRDLLMYKDLDGDLEVVITLAHDIQSLCEFVWYDRDGYEHRVRTEPNSLAIVKPNAALHCVSDTAGGRREILKFIVVADYAKPAAFKQYAKNDCDKNSANMAAIRRKTQELSDEL